MTPARVIGSQRRAESCDMCGDTGLIHIDRKPYPVNFREIRECYLPCPSCDAGKEMAREFEAQRAGAPLRRKSA